MKTAARILIFLLAAIFIIGGIASFEIVPREWMDDGPQWIKWTVGACFLLFSLLVAIGYVLDSGVIRRMLGSKQK
ncbi:MAG: hypothetical protein KF712_16890 [Akkermansiaceae bacterium]|nr:hypothetical protein [Akkermansiaceae bacterium]